MAGEEAVVPFPFHGDLLERILCHVTTADLPSSRHVSSTWRQAVSSSLRSRPRLKPWLVLHLHPHLRRSSVSVAYDPHSRTWVPLPRRVCPTHVRSSHPQLLFLLSSAALSITPSSLAATWTHLRPPRVRRYSPVVALVGSRVVVAGGACDAADAPHAVEVSDAEGWRTCDPFPPELGDSTSATWLSVATSDAYLHVIERCSGAFASFDPDTGRWSGACVLKPDPEVRLSAIGYAGGRLVLIGLAGADPDPDPLRLILWEVNTSTMECKEIGRMPTWMVTRLVGKGYGWPSSTVVFSAAGDLGYFCNSADFVEAFMYDFGEGIWESIERPKEVVEDPTARIVIGCSTVGMDDVDRVFGGAVRDVGIRTVEVPINTTQLDKTSYYKNKSIFNTLLHTILK